MSNVFKGAPEVTFWGGIRFYDRYNTDPEDYFWLDTSGYGVGVYNIDVGIGKLRAAWIGGLNDRIYPHRSARSSNIRLMSGWRTSMSGFGSWPRS